MEEREGVEWSSGRWGTLPSNPLLNSMDVGSLPALGWSWSTPSSSSGFVQTVSAPCEKWLLTFHNLERFIKPYQKCNRSVIDE